MHIQQLQFIDGAKQAKGLTVVIDVFRAFSTACYVMNQGASHIIPVGKIEDAYRLKEAHPDYVLMGERGGVIQPGFDFGNSPTQAEAVRFDGRTIVHTTSAGTQGISAAKQAEEVITGSFVNAGAIVQYIKARQPEYVSLVAMGWGGNEAADEDTLCAQYLEAALLGRPPDFDGMVHYLKTESRTGTFLDAADSASAPQSDFDLCLRLNRFSFILKAEPWRDSFVRFVRVNVDRD